MKLLEERIAKDGRVIGSDILKVDGFLNHQIDVVLFQQMAEEWKRLFKDAGVNKILTIEASGIGLAVVAAEAFHCPLVFAKKSRTRNVITEEFYSARVFSFTHGNEYSALVAKPFLGPEDVVLIIDDFLANGAALEGLISIVEQAGAKVAGCGIAIEKAFQPGGEMIRRKGYRIESLARIASMSEEGITFC
jgi:xanthine phosphoribosyltransferase